VRPSEQTGDPGATLTRQLRAPIASKMLSYILIVLEYVVVAADITCIDLSTKCLGGTPVEFTFGILLSRLNG
jgi:hypothetical protein